MYCFILAVITAAFEPQSESPWLSGGIAAALFPQTHLVLSVNPASVGVLSEPGVSISASRPFGFRDLDRTAIAGGSSTDKFAFAGLASYSGRGGYGEATATVAAASALRMGIVAGSSVSIHQIQIEGFGSGTAVSTDLGLIARPFKGFFLGGSVRGLYSSSFTETGMGAVPRTVSGALGVCPVEGVLVAAGAAIHQYAGKEYSVVTLVEPFTGVSLSFSLQTPPVRMGMGLHVSLSAVSMQYGYSTHPELASGHSVALSYGSGSFHPEPLQIAEEQNLPEPVSFPININTATEEELVNIPGIGPSRASTIRNYIDTFGPFQSVDQLIEVPGIGATTLENLRAYLTV
ncbi:MAG: ComEA family DNA-binding protein [Candidatus Fermentibacteria bacterium]|nr:ComEA family DNA-binding protein [Candidatus Fermentibacteria bacterium]